MLALAALTCVTLRKRDPNARTGDAIAMRILLTHVQAVGSSRAFKAAGTPLYRQMMVSAHCGAVLSAERPGCTIRR